MNLLFWKNNNKPLEKVQDIENASENKGINKKLLGDINERVRDSLKDWGEAVNTAESVLSEDGIRLHELLNIYRNLELDPHISALRETIFNGVAQTPFEIENVEENSIFEKSWFFDFLKYTLDADLWGIGLINFIVDVNNKMVECENVNRWYIRPEQKGISTEMNIEKATMFFDKAPLEQQTIFLNKGITKGKYNTVAKRFIMKREVIQFWAVYNELFTTPFFVVNTDINNENHRKNLLDWLFKRKHSGFVVVGEEDKVSTVSGNTSGFNSYREFEKSSNEAMSKALLGSTMVLDDGSSRSQAEVHERNTNAFIHAKRIEVEFLINEKVIPILSSFGLISSNAVFKWNLGLQYEPKDWAEIISKLANNFSFEEEEISEKTGLKLTVKEVETPQQVTALNNKDIILSTSKQVKNLYNGI